MKCEVCGTEMLPLLTSCYCPNEENHNGAVWLTANDFVEVQPMKIPSSELFFLDYRFDHVVDTKSLAVDFNDFMPSRDLTVKYSKLAVRSDYIGIVGLIEDVD